MLNARPASKATVIREMGNGFFFGALLAGLTLCSPNFEYVQPEQQLSLLLVVSALAAVLQGLIAYWFFVE